MIKLKSLIIESILDNALQAWTGQDTEDNIELYVDRFNILKQRRFLQGLSSDISPWLKKSFKEFKQFIDKKSKEHNQIVAIKKSRRDADKVFENNRAIIIIPNTFEASCKYGAHTKWCVSGNIKKHWNSYTKRGIKFYFIIPKIDDHKYAVAVYPNGTAKEVWNELDEPISLSEFDKILTYYGIKKNFDFSNKISWNDWLKKHKHTINKDGSINIEGDVNLSSLGLTEFPLKFGHISGNFNCSGNKLTSLQGCPQSVGGGFYCHNNNLTSLQGCPKSVGGDFDCKGNKLTSLQGCPKSVGRGFYCYGNNLTSLQGGPQSVGGDFYCNENNLTSLQGSPQSVSGDFYCSGNNLTSLQGGPQIVGRDFCCYINKLTSLQGCPQSVGGIFYCHNNNLTSLQGCPKSVGESFYCHNNSKEFTEKEVRTICNVRGEVVV
jgi:hypothetical protein